MLPTALPALLARFTRRRQRSARAQEPADMGTAFGMEQWLDERDRHAAPATARTSALLPAPSSMAASQARSRSRWLPRWLKLAGAGRERA